MRGVTKDSDGGLQETGAATGSALEPGTAGRAAAHHTPAPRGARADAPPSRRTLLGGLTTEAPKSYRLHDGTFVSDDLYRALLAAIGPAYIANADGALVYANPAFHEMAARLFADDENEARLTETPAALRDHFRRIRDDGAPEVHATDAVAHGTALVHFSSRHFPLFDQSGAIVAFVGLYADVTDRADATRNLARLQARYEDVIRSASDWIWETDHNLNLTFASIRIAETLGVPAEVIAGRYLLSIGRFAADTGPRAAPSLIRDRRPFRGQMFLVEDCDGTERRIHLSGVPVFDPQSGRFAGYRGTGTDVTRQVEAESAADQARNDLNEALEKLRERNRDLDHALKLSQAATGAKSEFLAMMSHELRTPLNAIIGFSEVSLAQMHGALGPRYIEYFRDISGAARHLLETIQSILELADLAGGRDGAAFEPVPAATLIDEALTLVSPDATQRTIDVRRGEIDPDLGFRVDRVRARQILVNLLSNAIKFTDPGGRVGIEVQTTAGEAPAVVVWDTGIGMSEDQLGRIFEGFYRAHRSAFETGPPGLGLGLTISRYLARLMGGDIRAESQVGRGSRFTVTFPPAS